MLHGRGKRTDQSVCLFGRHQSELVRSSSFVEMKQHEKRASTPTTENGTYRWCSGCRGRLSAPAQGERETFSCLSIVLHRAECVTGDATQGRARNWDLFQAQLNNELYLSSDATSITLYFPSEFLRKEKGIRNRTKREREISSFQAEQRIQLVQPHDYRFSQWQESERYARSPYRVSDMGLLRQWLRSSSTLLLLYNKEDEEDKEYTSSLVFRDCESPSLARRRRHLALPNKSIE